MEDVAGIPTGHDEERFDGLISLDEWNSQYPGRLVFRTIGHGWDEDVPDTIDEAKNSPDFDDVRILITSQRFEIIGLIKTKRQSDVVRFVVRSNIKHAIKRNIPNPSMEIVQLGGE